MTMSDLRRALLPLLTALERPHLRARLGEVLTAGSASREKDDEMFLRAGLFSENDGVVSLDTAQVSTIAKLARETLTPDSPALPASLPKNAHARAAFLDALASAVITPNEVLTEREISERLAKHCADVTLFRRELVDSGRILRDADGSNYRQA